MGQQRLLVRIFVGRVTDRMLTMTYRPTVTAAWPEPVRDPGYFNCSSRLSVASQTWRGPSNDARCCATSTYLLTAGRLYCCCCGMAFMASIAWFLFIFCLLLEKSDWRQTKPVLVCWGHAVYMPKLIIGREAIFEFLLQNLPNIYIDNSKVTTQ